LQQVSGGIFERLKYYSQILSLSNLFCQNFLGIGVTGFYTAIPQPDVTDRGFLLEFSMAAVAKENSLITPHLIRLIGTTLGRKGVFANHLKITLIVSILGKRGALDNRGSS